MNDESQLQAGLSWAIPRYLEQKLPGTSWAAGTPGNQSQSSGRWSGSAYDMLAILNSSSAFLLEHKVLSLKKIDAKRKKTVLNLADGIYEKFEFRPGQFNAIHTFSSALPCYVCFGAGKSLTCPEFFGPLKI